MYVSQGYVPTTDLASRHHLPALSMGIGRHGKQQAQSNR